MSTVGTDPTTPGATGAEPDPADAALARAGAARAAASAQAETDPNDEQVIDLFDENAKSDTLSALEMLAEEERSRNPNWKGFSVKMPEAVLANADPEIKKLFYNSRSVAQRAARSFSEKEKGLTERERAIEADRAHLLTEQQKLLKMVTDPVAPGAEDDLGPEPDRNTDVVGWTIWSAQKRAAEVTAKRFAVIQSELQKRADAAEQARLQAVADAELTVRQGELEQWYERTPAVHDDAVFDAVKAKMEATAFALSPDEALNLVLIERGEYGTRRSSVAATTARALRRPSAAPPQADWPPIVANPSLEDQLAYMDAHPEVPQAEFAKIVLRAKGRAELADRMGS